MSITKKPWPFADDDWIVVSAIGNPQRVHRLTKWANGMVDVACGAFPLSTTSNNRPRRLVCSKSDHERGDWSEVFSVPRCTKCWPEP